MSLELRPDGQQSLIDCLKPAEVLFFLVFHDLPHSACLGRQRLIA
jgi:hypothetical protein